MDKLRGIPDLGWIELVVLLVAGMLAYAEHVRPSSVASDDYEISAAHRLPDHVKFSGVFAE